MIFASFDVCIAVITTTVFAFTRIVIGDMSNRNRDKVHCSNAEYRLNKTRYKYKHRYATLSLNIFNIMCYDIVY